MGSTEAEDFFNRLPAVAAIDDAIDTTRHVGVPSDWWVIIADVEGSTQAIEAGRYKHVNTVGVACIAAVVNLDRSLRLPYVFGGDGATLAIPPRLLAAAESALRGAQRMALDAFGLTLRVGLVPVSALTAQGAWVRVAKVRLSGTADLPVLSGRGWELAEQHLKSGAAQLMRILRPSDEPAHADFSGFECRWSEVPATRGVKLSLIVMGRSPDPQRNRQTLLDALSAVRQCLGSDEVVQPVALRDLRLSFSPRQLESERKVRAHGVGSAAQAMYLLRLWALNLVGRYLFWRYRHAPEHVWGRYKRDLIRQSDQRKFDGALRMVLDARTSDTDALTQWLEEQRKRGLLVYGLHRAPAALITCLVRQYDGDHMHFIDGADGGYAMAARQLKQQLRTAATPALQ